MALHCIMAPVVMYDVNVSHHLNTTTTSKDTAINIAQQLCKETGKYVSVKTQDTKVLLYAVSLCQETKRFIEYSSNYNDPFN